MQQFKCKRKGCEGVVVYEDGEIPAVFPDGLKTVMRRTKRVYLSCNNPEESHEYPYDVPVGDDYDLSHVIPAAPPPGD